MAAPAGRSSRRPPRNGETTRETTTFCQSPGLTELKPVSLSERACRWRAGARWATVRRDTRAIIIGAGRGSRLMPTTEDAPRRFAKIQGKRILDWTVDALKGGGCTEIVFIGGYRIESVQREYPDFVFRENKDWPNNNIPASLMCAEDLMDQPFVTSYSDILFTRNVVQGLIQSSDELALGVDTEWREHYKPRTQHPPHDAEKPITRGDKVERVYRTIPYDDATGEFIGVAKFGAKGAAAFRDFIIIARPSSGTGPTARPRCFSRRTRSTCSRT